MSLFFSIITPTFNRSRIISKTIQSVLNQTFNDFEYIIVDDGSSDNTEEVVESFEDERIKYYKKENGERGAARNFGVSKSSGKYVFFLDSDDYLYPHHLATCHKRILELNRPEFFYSRYSIIDEDGKKVGEGPLLKNPIQQVLNENPFACLVFLRKDIAVQYSFKEDRPLQMLEDWLLWLQIAARFPLNFNNQTTCAIGMHDFRSMATADAKKLLDAKDIMIRYLKNDSHFESKYGSYLPNIESNLISLAALQASLNFDKKALRMIAEAIKLYPAIAFKRRTLTILKNGIISVFK